MKKLFTLFLLCSAYFSNAQMERYTAKENPYYWKNRAPYAGYWQQDVYYKINATLDDATDIITGIEELTYKNNSPDTLHYVFFHLYQNAFVKNSYLHELNEENNFKPRLGKYDRPHARITSSIGVGSLSSAS